MAYLSPRLGGSGYRRKSETSAAGRDLQQGYRDYVAKYSARNAQAATEGSCCTRLPSDEFLAPKTLSTPVSEHRIDKALVDAYWPEPVPKVEHPWALRLLWFSVFGMIVLALAWPWVAQ